MSGGVSQSLLGAPFSSSNIWDWLQVRSTEQKRCFMSKRRMVKPENKTVSLKS